VKCDEIQTGKLSRECLGGCNADLGTRARVKNRIRDGEWSSSHDIVIVSVFPDSRTCR